MVPILAHGALGPFDELIPLLVSGFLALMLLFPVLVKRIRPGEPEDDQATTNAPPSPEITPPSESDDHFSLT